MDAKTAWLPGLKEQTSGLGWIEFVIFSPDHQSWSGDAGDAANGIDKEGLLGARQREMHEGLKGMGVRKQTPIDFRVRCHLWLGTEFC